MKTFLKTTTTIACSIIVITLFFVMAAYGYNKEYKLNKEKNIEYIEKHNQIDNSIKAIVNRECKDKHVDAKIVLAIIDVESGGNAKAVGDNGDSLGLMQIQPRWHRERMQRLGVDDLLDPVQNIKVGVDILRELQDKYTTNEEVLTVYNCGYDNKNRHYYNKIKERMNND